MILAIYSKQIFHEKFRIAKVEHVNLVIGVFDSNKNAEDTIKMEFFSNNKIDRIECNDFKRGRQVKFYLTIGGCIHECVFTLSEISINEVIIAR